MNSVQRTLKQQTASVLGKAGVFIVLAFFFTIAAFPLVWLFISSLKTNLELQISPFTLPKVLQWSNYGNALKMANLPALFLHSIYVHCIWLLIFYGIKASKFKKVSQTGCMA